MQPISRSSPGEEGRLKWGVCPQTQALKGPPPTLPCARPLGAGRGRPSYLLLLEVQELHGAHLAVGLPAGGSFARPGPSAAPAAIGLVAEAADPILAGRSRAYRLRGRFNHHDLLAGPGEERAELAIPAWRSGRSTQGWDVKPRPVLAAFSLLQKINVWRCELPWTRCQPCAATGRSKCNPSLRKTPRLQLSPSLTRDIKPQELKHFSQNCEIFHFEKLEMAKLKLQWGCAPNARSLRHIFHHENLNKVDTFPQRLQLPAKQHEKSAGRKFAEQLRKTKGTVELGRSRTGTGQRFSKHQPGNPPFSQTLHALRGPSRVLRASIRGAGAVTPTASEPQAAPARRPSPARPTPAPDPAPSWEHPHGRDSPAATGVRYTPIRRRVLAQLGLICQL